MDALRSVARLTFIAAFVLSGGELDVLRDASGRIRGVAPSDRRRPLKRGGFPAGCEAFAVARSYEDWRFIAP